VQCRSGACVGGTCTIPGAKVTGQGLLECAVGESSGSSPSAPSPWAFLVVGAAVLLRRRGERGTSAR
jgi:MYXO-CTERM domain-containing protein